MNTEKAKEFLINYDTEHGTTWSESTDGIAKMLIDFSSRPLPTDGEIERRFPTKTDRISQLQLIENKHKQFGAKWMRDTYSPAVDVEEIKTDPYPDNEADGIVFCGKCGKMK